jgi:hypothetical protein
MGMLNSLLGDASEVDAKKMQAEYAQILAEGENVEKAYQVFRDAFLFTSKRLILVDVQGLTSNKVEYHSFPYRNITHFSVETAGRFDLDAELKIWVAGNPAPIQKSFSRKLSIYQVQAVLANYVLR